MVNTINQEDLQARFSILEDLAAQVGLYVNDFRRLSGTSRTIYE